MPYEFQIDRAAGIIRETWTGSVTYDELVDSCRAEWAHPEYSSDLSILCDFRRARARLSADEVLKFASWFSNDDAPPRLAIVVRRARGLDFAAIFLMIWSSHRPDAERIRLFFSLREADLWLSGLLASPGLPQEHSEAGRPATASAR